MDGEDNGKPNEEMDDLGGSYPNPLFLGGRHPYSKRLVDGSTTKKLKKKRVTPHPPLRSPFSNP